MGKILLYRRNLVGRGVRVAPDEYIQIIGTFAGYVLLRIFWTGVVGVASAAAFFAMETTIYVGEWNGISIVLGLISATIYCWWQRKRDWQRIDDRLAGRKKAGRNRSPEDAKLLRLALSGWTPIWYCITIVMIPVVAMFDRGIMPRPSDWLWLTPLGMIILGGLGWVIYPKLQARRIF